MLIGPQKLAANVICVRNRIVQAAVAAGRAPDSVTLIAVSKTQGAESVRDAAMAGVTEFGENYLQEAIEKMDAVASAAAGPLHWHFIGTVQSNKTRSIAERFDWVHGIDRLSHARRLAEQRPFHAPALNLCIQVALVPEPTKGGIAPSALPELANAIARLQRVRLRGLMCVPPLLPDVSAQRAVFARLRGLLHELNAGGLGLDTLSMGMSGDFEAAIAEGATHVRIGTAVFGPR